MPILQAIISHAEMGANKDPYFTIRNRLIENGFDLEYDLKREDDFFNRRIIYTQEVSNG